MKGKTVVTAAKILAFVLVTILSACHGGGGGGTSFAPSITFLTVGVPVSDVVSQNSFNDYGASVIPGQLYKISVTNLSDDAVISFFGTDGSFSSTASCGVDNTTTPPVSGTPQPKDCIVNAPGDTLYFSVDGSFLVSSSAAYTIDVEQLAITSLNPSVPVLDSTTQTSANVYSVPVTAGVPFTAAITGLNDDAELYVFGSSGTFATQAACIIDNTRFIGTTPEDCTLTTTGSPLYFIVDGIFSTKTAVDYTAFATAAPAIATPGNEGTAGSPVALSADTPTIGQVAFSGASFYAVSGLTPGSRYTVSINGLTANGNLTVYNADSTFTTPAACLIDNILFSGTTPESCTLAASGGTIYFKVSANTTSGGLAFINLVEPGP